MMKTDDSREVSVFKSHQNQKDTHTNGTHDGGDNKVYYNSLSTRNRTPTHVQ